MDTSSLLVAVHPSVSVRRARRPLPRSLLIALLGLSACDSTSRSHQDGTEPLLAVALPADLDRVLRDYERASSARDGAALAALFTPDGIALAPGAPPVRGPALGPALAARSGDVRLVPVSYAVADSVAYIIGTFGSEQSAAAGGKFVLALRRSGGGPWRIAADIDNANR